MIIETKKLSEITPASYNPRSISPEAMAGLKASIQEFGIVEPIILNSRTGNLVGGHMRLEVLKQQGATETEVVVVDLSLEKEKALNITLNNRHIAGTFTADLEGLLEEIELELPDLYSDLNLEELLVDIPEVIEVGGTEEPEGSQEVNDTEWVDVRIGKHEGQIPFDVYQLFISEHDRLGDIRETDKMAPILESMVINSANTPKESLV